MDEPRYQLATVTGYLTAKRGSYRDKPGLSVHVCDTWNLWCVVATFRSERTRARGDLTAHERTMRRAELHAAELNG